MAATGGWGGQGGLGYRLHAYLGLLCALLHSTMHGQGDLIQLSKEAGGGAILVQPLSTWSKRARAVQPLLELVPCFLEGRVHTVHRTRPRWVAPRPKLEAVVVVFAGCQGRVNYLRWGARLFGSAHPLAALVSLSAVLFPGALCQCVGRIDRAGERGN